MPELVQVGSFQTEEWCEHCLFATVVEGHFATVDGMDVLRVWTSRWCLRCNERTESFVEGDRW